MRRAPLVPLSGLVIAFLYVGAAAAPGREPVARAAMDGMEMVGNAHEFPDLAAAGRSNVARARRLLRASRSTARRFDTLAEARRQGYTRRRLIRPGFAHFRKKGMGFWGRAFDPANPQALVFWCPSRGRCRLALYMYRAPAGKAPATWGDILMWHRHARTATWMTHVWLLRHTRDGFATCAPAMALEHELGIHLEPYRPDVTGDRPCTTEGAMAVTR